MFDFSNTNFTVLERTGAVLPSYVSFDSLNVPTIGTENMAGAYEWLSQCLVWSTTWKTLLLILVLTNFKNFPLVYHLRILNAIRFVLRSQRSPKPLTPSQLFQPLITSSKATLMETDVFGHKSNSTYFSDVDVARTHLVTTMFSKAIEDFRGSTTMNGLSGKPTSSFTMPLGAVSCCFRRQLKPYEKYDMWTRILSWDEKWFYLVTHFVSKGAKLEPKEYSLYPKQMSQSSGTSSSRKGSAASMDRRRSSTDTSDGTSSAVAASALSKVVFKNGRITVAPEVMLELAGLLPKRPETNSAQEDVKDAQMKANIIDGLPINQTSELPSKVEQVLDADSGDDSSLPAGFDGEEPWTRDRIEVERRRGIKLADLLAGQSALEHELNDSIALGRHYDGHGIEGVVSTLAQLGKMSNYQLL